MGPETSTCALCGAELPAEQMTQLNDQTLCPACLEEETTLCDHCGERIWRTDDHGDGQITLCRSCARHYSSCPDCGRMVAYSDLHYLPGDNTNGYCSDCYNLRIHGQGVRSYSYKPNQIFYGEDLRFMGVELEIDGGGESDYSANRLLSVGNQVHDHIYIKHDGSLTSGLEIVTHPMTLDYHRKKMPWQPIIRMARKMGYTSHKTGSCGLHIHVNRTSLGETCQQQEDTIARILFLVETFWDELLRFSRRTQFQMDRWASRYGREDDPKALLSSAKSRSSRYACVNVTPSRTIEFRMFRGTLKYNTLIATLQMVERLCNVAFSLQDNAVKKATWIEFVSDIPADTMPELIQYLKERQLYVNEPVAAQEEV